ncbi:hypothetical protein [Flexithrix dorotheae]|uniref:hypothetical protein n=1 Tax=Flexithrix dorotheae TaxID=70993 RepID=UPI000361CB80|nr:hypothetical protein [Flexithrix dorotheae]
MKKYIGITLIVIGLFGALLTGYNAIEQAESLQFLGMNITISEQGSFVPVVAFGVVFLSGIGLLASDKSRSSSF